jgi:hypothetical protein
MSLNPAQQQVVELLGRREPVTFEHELGAELAMLLESELADLEDVLEGQPLWVSKHDLVTVHGCETHHLAAAGTFEWSVATVRGAVAHKAIELSVFWRGEAPPAVLVEEAVERVAESERGLARFVAGLSAGSRAQLVGEANDLVAKFQECFPPLKPAWRPVAESRAYVELLGGRLVLTGKVDLTLGGAKGLEAGKVIIDLKTGMPTVHHRDDLRFYALLETIKLGVPPRKVATYYLDAARPSVEDVTEDLLVAAARRAIAGIRTIVELTRLSREPTLRPGPSCRWCPRQAECEPGLAHLAGDG